MKRQYIGNLGTVKKCIVSVDTHGVLDKITFSLIFEIYKPKARLKENDYHRSKPKIAATVVQLLCNFGFEFELVLTNSAYGESGSSSVEKLHQW